MRLIRSQFLLPENQTIQEDILQHRGGLFLDMTKAKTSLLSLLEYLKKSPDTRSAFISLSAPEDYLKLYLSAHDKPMNQTTFDVSFSGLELFSISYRMPKHLAPWDNAYVTRSNGFPKPEAEAAEMIFQAMDFSQAWILNNPK
jgi:hypothetical protein